MWCSMCPFYGECEDPPQRGGGCDCDGADDYGVDSIDDGADSTNQQETTK